MALGNDIEKIKGLRYMTDRLEIQSGLGRRILYASPFLKDKQEIQSELDKVEYLAGFLSGTSCRKTFSEISIKLQQIKDIRGTISRISTRQVLNDIELFEVKSFSLLAMEIRFLLYSQSIHIVELPDLEAVISLLDPDNTHIPNFYIYDSYSEELKKIRKKIKALSQPQDKDDPYIEKLYLESIEIEDKIRENISAGLYPHYQYLYTSLLNIAHLDILLAKAKQSIAMQLCKPEISESTTTYTGIFNPGIRQTLQAGGKDFQAIDIQVGNSPILITGANMAGKTVILKTLALAQMLFQYGFYVPAKKAETVVMEEVILSIGDEQDELKGLSSFAAEMYTVNNIIKKIREGKKLFVLIDEMARTTNPAEGKALVSALLDFFTEKKVSSVITTHYSGIKTACRKLRVKGFIEKKPGQELKIQDIHTYMDYSLTEDTGSSQVPEEAIRIARLLGIDSELLNKAKHYLEN